MEFKGRNQVFFILFFIPYLCFILETSSIFFLDIRMRDGLKIITQTLIQEGRLNYPVIAEQEQNHKMRFTCLENCQPRFGDIVYYKVEKEVTSFIIHPPKITIKIERQVLIGIV